MTIQRALIILLVAGTALLGLAPKAPPVGEDVLSSEVRSSRSASRGGAYTPAQPSESVSFDFDHPLTGAYKVMATLYQSCDVLELPYYNRRTHGSLRSIRTYKQNGIRYRQIPRGKRAAVAREHYYLQKSSLAQSPPICRDPRLSPPIYHYGGRPNYNDMMNGKLNLFDIRRTGGDAMTGIDCSAFVCSAFAASGLRLSSEGNWADNLCSTSRGFLSMGRGNDCFDRVQFSGNKSLESGDVLAWSGHVLMIDRVGPDPFGVDKAVNRGRLRSARDCGRWAPEAEDLNFSIIQSGSTGHLGVTRMHARDYFGRGNRHVSTMARAACEAKFTGSAVSGNRNANRTFSLIRHAQMTRPGCVAEPRMEVVGAQCVDDCFQKLMRGSK